MRLKRSTVQVNLDYKFQKYVESAQLQDYEIFNLKNDMEVITDVFKEYIFFKDLSSSSDLEAIDEWKHHSRNSLCKNLKTLNFHRDDVKNALSFYIENKWMWSDSLDWLFVDVLLYAEIIATINEISMKLLGGKNHGYDKFMDYKKDLSSFLIPAFEPPANWWISSLFLVAVLTGVFWQWEVGFLLVVYACYLEFVRKRELKKVQEILEKILQTYAIVETSKFSWILLWDTLVDNQKTGIVWDMEIYRLAEIRKSSIEAGSRA